MVQLVTHKQDGEPNQKQMWVCNSFQNSSTCPPKQKTNGTEAVVTPMHKNRTERRSTESNRGDKTTWLKVSKHPPKVRKVGEPMWFPFNILSIVKEKEQE